MIHKFLPSIKKDVNYCLYCGCLSYKNIPSKIKMPQNNYHNNIMNLDPLVTRYKPISLNIDFSLNTHINYVENRQKGLLKINLISQKFYIEKKFIHKAIGLMDQIYLNNLNTPIEYTETIAVLCLLLSIEFNYCCHNSNKKSLNQNKIQNYSIDFSYINNKLYSVNNIKNMHKYLMEKIDILMYLEIFCLKKLDYNLGKYSAFDYINLFFGLGIVFSKKNIDIINIYDSCVNLLEILINQYKICKYNQYIIAMSIIYIKFNNNIYFDKRIFKYIYGVDFSKQKYKSCINEIINIVNDLYNFGY
jgi:hypothetical protein